MFPNISQFVCLTVLLILCVSSSKAVPTLKITVLNHNSLKIQNWKQEDRVQFIKLFANINKELNDLGDVDVAEDVKNGFVKVDNGLKLKKNDVLHYVVIYKDEKGYQHKLSGSQTLKDEDFKQHRIRRRGIASFFKPRGHDHEFHLHDDHGGNWFHHRPSQPSHGHNGHPPHSGHMPPPDHGYGHHFPGCNHGADELDHFNGGLDHHKHHFGDGQPDDSSREHNNVEEESSFESHVTESPITTSSPNQGPGIDIRFKGVD